MTDTPPAPTGVAGPGLGRRAARGGLVSMGGQGVRILIQVASVVVLARLLSPEDYGLMAMVAVTVGIAEVFRDFGLSSAAIQARELSTQQRSNLFWVNSLIGLGLCLTMVAAAPLIAALFGRPELTPLAMVFASIFVINGVATQFRADLVRNLHFLRLVTADIVAPVVALSAAVVLAATGAGYWALAAQQILAAAVMLVIVAVLGGWMPSLPRRGVPMRHFFKFGGGLVASQLVNYGANNVDTFVIGLRFSATDLGLYSRGYQLLMVPLNQVRAPMTQVALPVLSRVADQQDRFVAFVGRGQLLLGYSVLPVLAFIVGAHEPVVAIMLGPQWLAVGPLLACIAAAAGFQMLAFVGYWVYLAKGLTGELFKYSMISAVIKAACILVGSQWGLLGVALGFAVAPALSWPLSLWWLSRYARLPARPLLLGALRMLSIAALLAAVVAIAVTSVPHSPWVQLVGGAAGAVVTGCTVCAVPLVRRDVRDLLHVARLARQGR